jgi:hypothetical protein
MEQARLDAQQMVVYTTTKNSCGWGAACSAILWIKIFSTAFCCTLSW